ncbi:hypothetical protein NHP20013_13750 [Helicobacter bizzozeronii]|nr:hypothetical protein NHP20013_13750 [Helicobacter bizzozeronii]
MTKTMLEPVSFDGIKDKEGVERALLEACSPEQMEKIRVMDDEIKKSINPLSKPTPEFLEKIKNNGAEYSLV